MFRPLRTALHAVRLDLVSAIRTARVSALRAAFLPAVAAAFLPAILVAQQPIAPRDSASPDSVTRHPRELAPVTVVAAPAERTQPLAATHVTAGDIRATPASTPYDLLRQAAGIEVHEQGQGPGFASDASLRGFSSDHSTDLALWIDGVPVNEPVNGHSEGYNDLSVLFPGGIEDIDVVRGPVSALFGNFALAGAVNVRTQERMTGTRVIATGASFGRADAVAMTGFDHGHDGGGVVGVRYAHDDGFRPNAGYDLVQGHGRLVRDLAPGVTIDGGAELYGTRWSSAGFLSSDEFTRHEYDIVSNPSDGGFKRRAQERASLRVLRGPALWRTTMYATQSQWQLFLTIPPAGGRFEGTGSQTEEEDHRAGAGLTSAVTATVGPATGTFGVEGRWDRSHYENYFTTDRTRDSTATLVRAQQTSGAIFLQSHVDPTERLRLDVGARWDELYTRATPAGERTAAAGHGVLSPKLGAMLRIAQPVALYANLSRGFRSTDGVIENPSLTPISAWSYEGGLKLDRGAAMATATLFRMDVSNEQTFNPVTLETTNGGASRRQGVELEWRIPVVSRAVLTGDWTFLDARYRRLSAVPEDGNGPPAVLDGLRVYNTSKYVGSAGLEIAARRTLRLRISGNWTGPYSPFDEPGVVTGGYGLMHLSAAWTIARSEIDVGVRNVLDRAYPELIAGDIVSPGQPRSLFVTTRLAF